MMPQDLRRCLGLYLLRSLLPHLCPFPPSDTACACLEISSYYLDLNSPLRPHVLKADAQLVVLLRLMEELRGGSYLEEAGP